MSAIGAVLAASAGPREGQHTPQKRADLLALLKPYEAVAAPEEAPEGSELHRLVHAALEAAAEVEPAQQRVAELRQRLGEARRSLAAAGVADEFSKVADAQAEVTVLGHRLATAEAVLASAQEAATTASTARDAAWSQVQSARRVLRQMIEFGDSREYRYASRAPHCWGALREFLDPGPEANVAPEGKLAMRREP